MISRLEIEPRCTDITIGVDNIVFLTSHPEAEEFIFFTIYLS